MKKLKNKVASILRIFSKEPTNFKAIPVFINNYNRLTTLTKLIDALVKRGYTNLMPVSLPLNVHSGRRPLRTLPLSSTHSSSRTQEAI